MRFTRNTERDGLPDRTVCRVESKAGRDQTPLCFPATSAGVNSYGLLQMREVDVSVGTVVHQMLHRIASAWYRAIIGNGSSEKLTASTTTRPRIGPTRRGLESRAIARERAMGVDRLKNSNGGVSAPKKGFIQRAVMCVRSKPQRNSASTSGRLAM